MGAGLGRKQKKVSQPHLPPSLSSFHIFVFFSYAVRWWLAKTSRADMPPPPPPIPSLLKPWVLLLLLPRCREKIKTYIEISQYRRVRFPCGKGEIMTSTKEIKQKLKNHWDELHLVLRHCQVSN